MSNNVLLQVNRQWSSRPNDERFTSLLDMQTHFRQVRALSRAVNVSTRGVQVLPRPNNQLLIQCDDLPAPTEPTNWAFGQLASLAKAPAGYLRTLPAELTADLVNYGLRFSRDIDDIKLLGEFQPEQLGSLRACTGPNYGRIWNSQVVDALVNRFGDGITGDWRVPGEFGREVVVTQKNTTLYASDRDMFVFLCDEKNRVEFPGRRDGKAGPMARGFYVWNSETGAATLGLGLFLFDFVCQNRMIWGVEGFQELKLRHTSAAPDRFLYEVAPALQRFAASAWGPIEVAISDAKKDKLADVDEFLAARFSKGLVQSIKTTFAIEENRPIETRYDAVVGATALARGYEHQDARVDLERQAGRLLNR